MREPVDEKLREAVTPEAAAVDRVVRRALAPRRGRRVPAATWAAALVVLLAAAALLYLPLPGGRGPEPPPPATAISLRNIGPVVAVIEPGGTRLIQTGARKDRAPGKMIIIVEEVE